MVFIGSGPSDPTATGTAYRTLITNYANMWNRRNTINCITILTNDPIYVDNDDYRVLGGGWDMLVDGTSEAYDLMDEANVADAVEVFVWSAGILTWTEVAQPLAAEQPTPRL